MTPGRAGFAPPFPCTNRARKDHLALDQTTYQSELLAILRQHTPAALATLQAFATKLPDKARAVVIMVHPNQDPDGGFSIWIHLSGPDLYVLGQAIKDCRSLFEVRFVDGRLKPTVPMFDTLDQPFDVNDVIVDTAIVWLKELWRDFGGIRPGLPVTAMGDDGYGTKGVVSLVS